MKKRPDTSTIETTHRQHIFGDLRNYAQSVAANDQIRQHNDEVLLEAERRGFSAHSAHVTIRLKQPYALPTREEVEAWPGMDSIMAFAIQCGWEWSDLEFLDGLRRDLAKRYKYRRFEEVDALSLTKVAEHVETQARDVARVSRERAKRTGNSTKGAPKQHDEAADHRLLADWQAAKNSGATRESFCRERGIEVQRLIEAQDRQRSNKRRDAD